MTEAWPTDLVPFQQAYWLQPHVARSESPFTRQQKTYGLSAPRWVCSMSFRGGYDGSTGLAAVGPRVDAQIALLEGGAVRALIPDFRRTEMRGPGWTDSATNEAAEAGATTMVLTGFAANAEKVVLAGDYIGGDGRPHIITRDADADSSGEATVTFKPELATYVGPDAALFGTVPGRFILTSDDAGSNATEVGGPSTHTTEFAEDLNRWPVPKLAAIGHSFVQRNNVAPADGSYIQTIARGEIVTAQALNPRFEFIVWADPAVGAPTYWSGANLGVSGDTSALALARLDALIALDADIWVIQLGINDIRASIAPATTMANIEIIAEAGLALGKQIIIANVIPVGVGAEGVGTWGLADPKRAAITMLNGLIEDYCDATRRVTLWDAYAAYDDGTGVPIAGYTDDGIHPSRQGAWSAGGPSLNTALSRVIDESATAIPTGTNLYTNGDMAGTAGTLGGGVTGVIATNWTFANASGTGGAHATAVGSKSAGKQRFVITSTASGGAAEIFIFSKDSGGITVTPGTWVQAWADVTLSAWAGWRQIIARAELLLYGMDYAAFDANDSMETATQTRMRIVTPPFLVPDGTTSVSPQIVVVVDGQANSSGTIDITQTGLARVDDPRTRYNF